jgi:hypothetical protein
VARRIACRLWGQDKIRAASVGVMHDLHPMKRSRRPSKMSVGPPAGRAPESGIYGPVPTRGIRPALNHDRESGAFQALATVVHSTRPPSTRLQRARFLPVGILAPAAFHLLHRAASQGAAMAAHRTPRKLPPSSRRSSSRRPHASKKTSEEQRKKAFLSAENTYARRLKKARRALLISPDFAPEFWWETFALLAQGVANANEPEHDSPAVVALLEALEKGDSPPPQLLSVPADCTPRLVRSANVRPDGTPGGFSVSATRVIDSRASTHAAVEDVEALRRARRDRAAAKPYPDGFAENLATACEVRLAFVIRCRSCRRWALTRDKRQRVCDSKKCAQLVKRENDSRRDRAADKSARGDRRLGEEICALLPGCGINVRDSAVSITTRLMKPGNKLHRQFLAAAITAINHRVPAGTRLRRCLDRVERRIRRRAIQQKQSTTARPATRLKRT